MGGPLFMDLFGARYQLGHCPVSCSSCNIDFFFEHSYKFVKQTFSLISFYSRIYSTQGILYIFLCKYNINMQRTQ